MFLIFVGPSRIEIDAVDTQPRENGANDNQLKEPQIKCCIHDVEWRVIPRFSLKYLQLKVVNKQIMSKRASY